MSDQAWNCDNNDIYKQIFTLKLFIALKMTHSLLFQLETYIFSNIWCFITLTAGKLKIIKIQLVVDVIKLFFEGILENLDFPWSKNSKNRPF